MCRRVRSAEPPIFRLMIRHKKCFALFVLFVLLVAQLSVFEFVPSVKAQEPSLPSTVWSEFPSFEPQMLTDYPSGDHWL